MSRKVLKYFWVPFHTHSFDSLGWGLETSISKVFLSGIIAARTGTVLVWYDTHSVKQIATFLLTLIPNNSVIGIILHVCSKTNQDEKPY